MEEIAVVSANEGYAHHSGEVREIAYQLWTYRAGRNAVEVAAMIALPEWGGHLVPARTIRYWASSQDWSKRAYNDLKAIAPDLEDRDVSELVFARSDAVSYLRRVASGQEDQPDTADILERLKYANPDDLRAITAELDARIKAHDGARKARLQACTAILDRTGLPSARGSEKAEPLKTGRSNPKPKLTTDERNALVARISGDTVDITPSPDTPP